MLNDDDQVWLVQQIAATAELLGHEIKPSAAALLADDLSCYPRHVLAAALKRIRTEHTGKLTPKAIIDRIDESMGRPAANEAWAVAVTALDERNTVVWTDEMAQAWRAAQPLAEGRDLVGARMAFIGAYERLVRVARDERRLPVVTVSEGWDGETRAVAVQKAVQLGYMPAEQAREYLPMLPQPSAFNPALLLIERVSADAVHVDAPVGLRERVARMHRDLAALEARRVQERAAAIKRAADDLAARKAAAQQMAVERLGQVS